MVSFVFLLIFCVVSFVWFIAVGAGFEPAKGDSVSNTYAGRLVVYPISLTYFFIPAVETVRYGCQFHHPTIFKVCMTLYLYYLFFMNSSPNTSNLPTSIWNVVWSISNDILPNVSINSFLAVSISNSPFFAFS